MVNCFPISLAAEKKSSLCGCIEYSVGERAATWSSKIKCNTKKLGSMWLSDALQTGICKRSQGMCFDLYQLACWCMCCDKRSAWPESTSSSSSSPHDGNHSWKGNHCLQIAASTGPDVAKFHHFQDNWSWTCIDQNSLKILKDLVEILSSRHELLQLQRQPSSPQSQRWLPRKPGASLSWQNSILKQTRIIHSGCGDSIQFLMRTEGMNRSVPGSEWQLEKGPLTNFFCSSVNV